MRKTYKQYLLIFSYSLFISVIAGEIYLRIAGTYDSYYDNVDGEYLSPYDNTVMWPRSRHGNASFTTKKPEFEHLNEYNTEGLRDIEHSIEKDSGVYRILVLGDSYTEGFGSDFEDTWFRVLQRNLNNTGEQHIEVINGAFRGSDPIYSIKLYETQLKKYRPDLILLAVNRTDIMDVVVRGGKERYLSDSAVVYNSKPKLDYLFSKSHMVRMIVLGMLDYDWYLMGNMERASKVTRSVELLNNSIVTYAKELKAQEIRLVVAFHPFYRDVIRGNYTVDMNTLIEQTGKVETLDLMKYSVDNMPVAEIFEYYWEEDEHYTPKGNRVFAQGLMEYLDSTRVSR